MTVVLYNRKQKPEGEGEKEGEEQEAEEEGPTVNELTLDEYKAQQEKVNVHTSCASLISGMLHIKPEQHCCWQLL